MGAMRAVYASILTLCLAAGSIALAQQKSTTVIHVVNVKWKAGATPEQIKAALDRAHELPGKFKGIVRVWTKNIKYQAQEGFNQAIVMEFQNEAALQKYHESPAQKWWYEAYDVVRETSRTHDITN